MSTASPPLPAQGTPERKFNKWPFWAPRFWNGMRFGTWFRLIQRNHFDLPPRRWHWVAGITLTSMVNSLFSFYQRLVYSRRIERTEIQGAPIFIIGHWRSGTTYLHELFMLDSQFSYPATYECFVPEQCVMMGRFFRTFRRFFLPGKRPMDDVATSWDRPQEDEFALCNMGLGSPYTTIAFPNHPPQDQEYLEMENVPADKRDAWKAGFIRFIKTVTYRDPKRIVLKSPPHTARIKVLLEMFPDARFVHIVRDPFVIFPSTMRLWKSLYDVQSVQVPTYAGLEEYVFDNFERMYARFDEQHTLIPPGRLCEVRYEELVRNPVGQMRAVYEQLGLVGFDAVLPELEKQAAAAKDYQTNRYDISPELQAQISRRWSRYIQRYGYFGN